MKHTTSHFVFSFVYQHTTATPFIVPNAFKRIDTGISNSNADGNLRFDTRPGTIGTVRLPAHVFIEKLLMCSDKIYV